jgi:hypothetical protein
MESFQLTVCSPDWLANACQKHGYVLGRHPLIVKHFDPDSITKMLTTLIDRCAGELGTRRLKGLAG